MFIKKCILLFLAIILCSITCYSQQKEIMNKDEKKGLVCDPEDGSCKVVENKPLNEVVKKVNNKDIPKLIYYYDALCGWCYGFSTVIENIVKEYDGKVEVEVISGGLFTGERVGKINDVAAYIKQGAYKFVEERTGVNFGKDFLNILFGSGEMLLDSMYPSIALCIVKDKAPEKQFEFAEILLSAFYKDGLSANNIEGYLKYVEKIGLDKAEFKKAMDLPEYKEAALKEFNSFKSKGLTGMPSLVLEKNGQQQLLGSGYLSFKELDLKLKNELH